MRGLGGSRRTFPFDLISKFHGLTSAGDQCHIELLGMNRRAWSGQDDNCVAGQEGLFFGNLVIQERTSSNSILVGAAFP